MQKRELENRMNETNLEKELNRIATALEGIQKAIEHTENLAQSVVAEWRIKSCASKDKQ